MLDLVLKKYPIVLVILIGIAQTFASIVPGMLQVSRTKSSLPSLLLPLIFYCLISNIFQFFSIRSIKKNVTITRGLFAGKFIISCVFIVLIGFLSNFFFSVILLTFEVFQFVLFWRPFRLFDTLFFPLLNSFYCGFVFNVIVSISFPFHFSFSLIESFIFSFLLFLLVSIFTQAVKQQQHKETYLTLVLVIFVLSVLYLLFSFFTSKITFVKLALLIVANIPLFIWFFNTKLSTRKELILYIFLIVNFFIYYK